MVEPLCSLTLLGKRKRVRYGTRCTKNLIETTYKGERWLLARPKTGDKGVLAWFWSMCLYAEVGARAAPARLVTFENGELWIGLKVPEGYSPGTFESLQKFRPNLSAEYPADAWLANWSVFGPKQNTVSKRVGKCRRHRLHARKCPRVAKHACDGSRKALPG